VRLLPLLLAGLYSLPGVDEIPAPDAPQAAAIAKALATIRTEEGEAVDRAVRELALAGEAALPAIVARLNEAGAGERLLLLAAASPTARAAPLLEQAREDPHPAVRAWASGPPPGRTPPLRELATRYLDLLAVGDPRLYDKAAEDLQRFDDRLGQPPTTLDAQRQRMKDQVHAAIMQQERGFAAEQFAVAGAAALARGELAPDLADPVFVAYVGLLREDSPKSQYAFHLATLALVKLGDAASSVLEPLLQRASPDPLRIVRVYGAMRADGGRALFDRFDTFPADTQSALVGFAPDVLDGDALRALLEKAALAEDPSVRSTALNGLLDLPPPAGCDVAKALLDPEHFGPNEFRRAAALLARSGVLDPLEQFATLPIPPPGPRGDTEPQLRNLRESARAALRSASGDGVEAMGRRLLEAEGKALRTLGIDLVRDPGTLLAYARAEPVLDLARAAALRVLRLHGADAADDVVALLRERGIEADTLTMQGLVACGRIDLVVGLAQLDRERTRRAALRALSNLRGIDARFEPALLALYDAAPDAERRTALAALLPLGTEEVRKRFEAEPDLALPALRSRVEDSAPIPFPYPLRRFLAGADPARLRLLGDVAEGVPSLDPGLFHELFRAWEALEGVASDEDAAEESPAQHKVRLLDGLARSNDAVSAKLLFDRVVAGELREPPIVRGTLAAAARLLPAEELVRLLPLLREQVKGEYPMREKRPPPNNLYRRALLLCGFNALCYAHVEAALDDLSDIVLDPQLQPAAFEWRPGYGYVPYWALDALRELPMTQVEPAFRRALARAEADGRLAAADSGDLFDLVQWTRNQRERGRQLSEVALAVCEVLERLPVREDVAYERMLALGNLGRPAEAAAAARLDAARKRARQVDEADTYQTPERLEVRARLYDARAKGEAQAIFDALGSSEDPFLCYIATWYLLFDVVDLDLAARAAEAGVRSSAGLWYTYRDALGGVRVAQGRPSDALRLLDMLGRVPAKPLQRDRLSRWHHVFAARAHLLLNDPDEARRELEQAVRDRRILPTVRRYPEFAPFAEVFRRADENYFFDELFARERDD